MVGLIYMNTVTFGFHAYNLFYAHQGTKNILYYQFWLYPLNKKLSLFMIVILLLAVLS